jgi:sigma-70-like protein
VRAFQQGQADAPEQGDEEHPGRTDAIRAWLATGIHAFTVDPRRRFGKHGRARQLLAEDQRSAEPAGAWQGLASALGRHTVRGGMAELGTQERRVITLAYLEGRTNAEIAAILGVSVSTVRRRLWMGLKQLDAYITHTKTWLSAVLLVGASFVVERAARLGRSANAVGSADWTHRLASTVAVGAVTAAAIGLTAVIPDSNRPQRSAAPATDRAIAAVTSPSEAVSSGQQPGRTPAEVKKIVVVVARTHSSIPLAKVVRHQAATTTESDADTDSEHRNRGCGGNPTSAPPQVPVRSHGYHRTGFPVSHPTAGGCRG